MTLDEWRLAGKTFSHRGHSIFYREEGQGDVLLLVHGFPTASWDWHRVWDALAMRFRLVAPDMIGFGFSAKPRPYPYSIDDQASLHEELLAQLGIGRVRILAHDYGDTVTQELLARFADRRAASRDGIEIESICFLNGGLFPESHRARTVQRLLATPLGPILARLSNERSFGRSFAAIFGPRTQPSKAELHDFWRLVAHQDGSGIMHLLIRYIEERRRFRERWVGALQKSEIPLRFVDGPLDPVSGAHMAERYRELVPNADVVLLDGIGHYPQVEDPAGMLKAFFDFVAVQRA